MLKSLTFRRSVDGRSKKNDDDYINDILDKPRSRSGRRRTRSSNRASAVAYSSSQGGRCDRASAVRRRGGPISTPANSPWQTVAGFGSENDDDLDALLNTHDNMERGHSSRTSLGSQHSHSSITREDVTAVVDAAGDDASISDASFAVRAASMAFSDGGSADAAAQVVAMATQGELGDSVNMSVSGEGGNKDRRGSGAVYGAGRGYSDYPSDGAQRDALKDSYRHHLRAIKAGEGGGEGEGSSSDPSGSDADAAIAKIAGELFDAPAQDDPDGKRQAKRSSGVGRRNFSKILSTEDAIDSWRRSGLSARSGLSSAGSLAGAMLNVLESDSSNSGAIGIEGKDAAFARRRRQRNSKTRRLSGAQRACVALAAVSAFAGALLALVLPRDSAAVTEAKTKAKHAAGDVGLALKVLVSGREAAGLPVAARGGNVGDVESGGGKREVRDLETRSHSLVRGAHGVISDAVQDQAVRDGNNIRMRALEQLHRPVNEAFAASDGDNAAAANGNPKVLPPLEAYNTAAGPGDSGIFIPTFTSRNYADVWTPVSRMDVPMYWHIPKSGGTTVQDVLGHCLNMVQASDIASHDKELAKRFRPSLDILKNPDGLRYVNVDTTTVEGIQHAKRLGLAASGKADVVITHRFHDVSSLFSVSNRGRAFALFRHPVRRAVSMFYYLQTATWEPTYDESLADMSLLEYANSDRAEENWVVRSLTNEFEEAVGAQHLEVAKEILRRKVIVGIMESFDQSIVRFEQYFSWWDGVANDVEVLRCQRARMSQGDNRFEHPKVGPGSVEFLTLAKRNWADVELYDYVKKLFQEQASLV